MSNETIVSLGAITAAALVGLAGVIGPIVLRHGDRKHERKTEVLAQRAAAYTKVLAMMHGVDGLRPEDVNEKTREPSILLWLWGTPEVRARLKDWLGVLPSTYGPDATDAERRALLAAANGVRRQMATELQAES